jgi:hypothetical protein
MFDVNKWLKIFDYKKLEAFLKSEKGKGGMGEALVRVIAAFLVYQVPLTIISILAVLIYGASALASTYGSDASTSAILGGLIAGGGILLVVGIFIVALILTPIFFLIRNGVLHVICGLLGGKGTFEGLLQLASFITAATLLASLVLDIIPSLLTLVPTIGDLVAVGFGCLLLPLGIALWLYMIYATYKALMVNYALSSGRAIAAIIIEIIFWLILFMILGVIAFLLFGASLASLGLLGSEFSGY